MRLLYSLVFFMGLILLCLKGFGQSISENGEILSTQATNPKARPDAKKEGPKKKNIRYIVRSDSDRTGKDTPQQKRVQQVYA